MAGTAAVGAIAGTIYAFAEHFQYATVEILISGGITGVVMRYP